MTKDVTDPTFPHGTERGYFRGCHEPCCMEGKRRAHAKRDLLKSRGIRMTMPVEPVREHLIALMQHEGFTLAAISRVTGVSPKTVGLIYHGVTYERVRLATGGPLLKVTPEQVAAEVRMVPSKRPIQQTMSLMALGHRGSWISARLGYAESCGTGPPQYVAKAQGWMTRGLAERIDALAREVGDRPGPSPITAKRVRNRGWHVPGAYDDNGDLIPWAVRVDERAEALAEEREQRDEFRRRVAEMRERGAGPRDIADALDVHKSTVEAALAHLARRAG